MIAADAPFSNGVQSHLPAHLLPDPYAKFATSPHYADDFASKPLMPAPEAAQSTNSYPEAQRKRAIRVISDRFYFHAVGISPRPGRPNAVSPSPAEYLRPLKEHKQQATERESAGSVWNDIGLVFTTPTGRPLDPANLTRRFRSFLNRVGLRRIRFHDLRHSTATLLLEQGVDLVVIKELLGHARIGVTAGVYAHVRLRLQRQAIDTLGTTLGLANDEPDDPADAAAVR